MIGLLPDKVLHKYQKAYPAGNWNHHRIHHERLRNAWFYGHLDALRRHDLHGAVKARLEANRHHRLAWEDRWDE